MTSIYEVKPDVMPEVPACPEPVAENAIWHAANDWLKDTRAWTMETDWLEPQPDDKSSYVFEVPDGVKPLSVETVDIAKNNEARRIAHNLIPPNTITVGRETDNPLKATIAMQLARDAEDIPDWLFERAYEGISAGAKYRLMRMLGVEWSNPEMSNVYRQTYHSEVSGYRVDYHRGHAQRQMKVKPVFFE